MDTMLRKALWGFLGPLVQLVTNLLSPEVGAEWEAELKKFLRKEPCWMPTDKAAKTAALAEPTEKFALLADLGTITVPADYDHAKQLDSFKKKNKKKFYFYNEALTDVNFGNPSRVLKPGDKLRVCAFRQTASGTTSEERLAFLATQKAVHVGAQGASIVFEEKRDQLPKGYWYASFDEKDRLWEDVVGYHRVPSVDTFSDGDFKFDLGLFENPWDDDNAFLCFCDEKPSVA